MASSIPELQDQSMSREAILHSTPASHHRFHILDALRGIAAIFVVCWHTPSYISGPSMRSIYLAVDFFFCLSGFVIAFSYERRLATWMGLGKFFLARSIRLYPAYFVGCLLGMLTFLYLNVHFPLSFGLQVRLVLLIVLQFAMLPNLHIWNNTKMLFPFNYTAWSMFFEVLANVGYAALLRKRLAGNGVLVSLYMLSLGGLFWWTRSYANIDVGYRNLTADLCSGLARVTLSFIAGVLVLRIYREMPRPELPHFLNTYMAIAIGAALALLLLTPFAVMRTKPFALLTVALLFPALVYFGSLCKAPQTWTGFCAFLGDMSYPLYLLHRFFFTIVAGLPFTMRLLKSHPRAQVAVTPAVLLISGVASFIAVKYYDAPLRAYLTRKFNRRPDLRSETAQP